ncbi:uncharacterized protein LOC129587461 [Paramacrobiotus metropolitanus]|uniref:uncharacterized protein LOC129587461 n=1 Tax=Paramacrobiotus metropolitanus TaxID=2943436 RepID=UPI002445A87E|nr:uncharacterized protein LOC129587461 [Paramacrobiotus metropolitanus]
MEILSFPTRFPRSRPLFPSKDFLDYGGPSDLVDRLKEREERLEAKRKALCHGGRGEDESHDLGDTSRADFASVEDEEEEDDMDVASTSSNSIIEPSDGQEDEVEDEIPLDDSETEEIIQIIQEPQEVAVEVDLEEEHVIESVDDSALQDNNMSIDDSDNNLVSNDV